MIKNYKDYIKEQRLDIDPFDEEDWDIDNLSPLLQIVRKQYSNKPYDEITELNCSGNQLTSLEEIENLVNLERL
jgi:Leucine-rich repeat (LRR) protein